jgi:Icc-related predicted phosphoesterase
LEFRVRNTISTVVPRFAAVTLIFLGCGPGELPEDYPPPPLADLGLHQAPTYVARDLMPIRQLSLVLAHPRLGQPAIRLAREPLDVGWIGTPDVDIALSDGTWLGAGTGECDGDGVCHLSLVLPALAPGLYGLCVRGPSATACSPGALAVVAEYHDPATIVQLSDAHIGDDENAAVLAKVIDAVNALVPAPDLVVFTGDAADTGQPDQRATFLAELAQLRVPAFCATGNHDYDHTGIDGWLLDLGPELDYVTSYGGLHLVTASSGQDLDDGQHNSTISESSAPDHSQLAWLADVLDDPSPAIVFFHHPVYNALFATLGPRSRDEVRALVTRASVRAVLAGHTHISAVFDADGNSRGLDLGADTVPQARWPLHYVSARSTRGTGGYAVLHVGTSRVDYRWVDL